MTEDEARGWLVERFGASVVQRVAQFVGLVIAENERQNLVSPSSIASIWTRHVVDSAQLIALGRPGIWVDIGTGGGFPGMIVGLCRPDTIVMIEPRRRRAAFLQQCVDILAITNASVDPRKIEAVTIPAMVISARAVASVEKLLQAAHRCATPSTRWILPRGRSSDAEPGMFHVEHSITDPESRILTIDGMGR